MGESWEDGYAEEQWEESYSDEPRRRVGRTWYWSQREVCFLGVVLLALGGFYLACQDRPREASVPALVGRLRHADPNVRREAARELGVRLSVARDAGRRAEAVPALVEAAKDPDANVRAAAADALNKIDPNVARQSGPP